ncbi:AraC family transcriptional regulator [Nocardia thailandica]
MNGPGPEVKGILYPRAQAARTGLRRIPVGPALAPFADWYWSVRWDLRECEPFAAQVLSHPCVNITFERSAQRSGAWVTGVCTHRYVRELTGEGETFGLRFAPGGFGAFTGIDVAVLRDDSAPLARVLPGLGDDLCARVLAVGDDEGRRAVVEAALAVRASGDDPQYLLVRRIVAAMAEPQRFTRVDEVAQEFDVPMRTLQRLFRRYIGAGPKWVLRRYRLQDGADLLAGGEVTDLARLAADLGYFDQAHFSREFAAEIGVPPLEYARGAGGRAAGM